MTVFTKTIPNHSIAQKLISLLNIIATSLHAFLKFCEVLREGGSGRVGGFTNQKTQLAVLFVEYIYSWPKQPHAVGPDHCMSQGGCWVQFATPCHFINAPQYPHGLYCDSS